MDVRRAVRRAAFGGAAVAAVLPFLPLSAHADSTGSDITYAAQAAGSGFVFSFDENPEFAPVPDLFDVQAPTAISKLSSGDDSATATLATPGNIASLVSLLCVEATQLCEPLNSAAQNFGQNFPPGYPLSVTVHDGQENTATLSGKELGGGGAPISVYPLVAHAKASDSEVISSAGAASSGVGPGTPVVTVGSVLTTSHQQLKGGSVVSEATSVVKDVDIAGAIQIKQVVSKATTTNDGHGHITKTGSTTLSGVTAQGQSAEITDKGVKIVSPSDNGAILNQLNSGLNQALKQAGVVIKLVGATTSTSKNGADTTVNVNAGGVLVTYSHVVPGQVNGQQLPTLTQPCSLSQCPTQLQQQGVKCLIPPAVTPSNCLVGAPNPYGTYFGTAMLGGAVISSTAGLPPTFNFGNLGGLPSANGPTTTTIPGTPGTPGTPGSSVLGTTTTQTGNLNGTAPSPQVANNSSYLSDILKGTSGRLFALFPALFLVALGMVVGRYPPYPARLPAVRSPGSH